MGILKSVTLGEAGGVAAVAKPIPGSVSIKYSKEVMFCALALKHKHNKKRIVIFIPILYSAFIFKFPNWLIFKPANSLSRSPSHLVFRLQAQILEW